MGCILLPEIVLPRRIIFGEDAGEGIVGLLGYLSAKKVLVVTDGVISRLEKYTELINSLKNAGIEVVEFKSVPPEPPIEIGEKIAESAGDNVDAVLAVGGGSVIDAAKAALVKLHRPDVEIRDVAPFNVLGIEFSRPILVAVPTTAGTGSDASYGIVLTVHEGDRHYKMAVGSFEIVPYASVLDPGFPASAPHRIKVGAAIDVLSHAFEALSSNNGNVFSDALAEKAAILVFTELEKALEGDDEALSRLHLAATMAGIAFTNSGLGLAHAIAHSLGGELGIHHGTMVGIVLPRVIELNLEDPMVAEKLDRLKIILEKAYGLPAKDNIVGHIIELYKKVGQPTGVRELGVSREKYLEVVEKMKDEVFHDPEVAYAPVIPDPERLEKILLDLYEPR